MSNENNSLIYGKNSLQHIVGLEIESDYAVAFCEKDGNVTRHELPHKYWMLCNERLGMDWFKLDGNQHYQYGKQYDKHWKMRADREKYRDTKDLYVVTNPSESLMIKDGFTYYKNLRHDEVSILCFDLETTGVTHDDNSKVVLIANTLRVNGKLTRKLFCYDEYKNDAEMIKAWCKWVQEVNPAILCGHNIYGFDFPYLKYVAERNGDDLNLGRDGSKAKFSQYEAKFRVDGSRDLHYNKVNIYGREICDTMFLAYKYDIGRKYQSYGLKSIIEVEKLEKKDRVFYDAGTIKDNYMIPEEMVKIKAYAEFDADDALSLYDLMVAPFFYMTQMFPKPFQLMIESASGSQLNGLMVRSYLQNKHSIPKADEAVDFEGAISFGEPGVYPNSVSLDIASLYPSIMLQYKVQSPKKDPAGNMLKLLDFLRTERLKNKQLAKETGLELYKHLDTSQKIIINSLYGFMGASGLNYNYPEGAALTTEKGREILTTSMNWAKEKGFSVPKGDTDSITIYQEGKAYSKDEISDLVVEINSILPEYINFELDAVYDVLVVFKAKNYAYREGDKITMKGSAIKMSTKSAALKEMMKKSILDLLYLKPVEEILATYKRYVKEASQIETTEQMKKWASRKTLSSTMVESTRANETKVIDALKGSKYVEGDRFFTYFKNDKSLSLVENFDGDYDKAKVYENIYKTMEVLDGVIPIDGVFLNYKLKKNLPLVENL